MSVFFTKFQVRVRTRVVGRLGLGPGPYIVGRLGSGMRVSASFQLGYIALYRLVHGGGLVVAGGVSYTMYKERGECRGGVMPGKYVRGGNNVLYSVIQSMCCIFVRADQEIMTE